ncbi:hypothetical protein TNCV_3841091 [Trichonephila clavipes]|nr:hypothetical protein TNCV_3841091 [Trichonephila clavipes]
MATGTRGTRFTFVLSRTIQRSSYFIQADSAPSYYLWFARMGSRSRHPHEKDSRNPKQNTPRHDERTLRDGRNSLVVRVTDSRRVYHQFKPSTTQDQPCRGTMQVKSVESLNVLRLVWWGSYERGCQLKNRTCHLTMAQRYDVRHQKPSS